MTLSIILFAHFILLLIAIALIIALADFGRFIAHRIGIDAIELLARYKAITQDAEERRLRQEGARLAIQQQRKLLRGTPTAWDVEIEQVKR